MPLSVAQLIASAATSGEALRLMRATMNLTQADLVARADGAIGADQISLIERGKRPDKAHGRIDHAADVLLGHLVVQLAPSVSCVGRKTADRPEVNEADLVVG